MSLYEIILVAWSVLFAVLGYVIAKTLARGHKTRGSNTTRDTDNTTIATSAKYKHYTH